MDKDSLGSSLIIASLLLAVSILGGSYFLSNSIKRSGERLSQLAAAVGELKVGAIAQAKGPTPPSRQPARPGRPDPNKRYSVALGDAPVRGSAAAAISIVEWSDFQ